MKMIYRFCLPFIFILLIATNGLAADLTGSIGVFQPDDSVVAHLYGASPSFSLRLAFPYRDFMEWVLSSEYIQLANRSFPKDRLDLYSLATGFQMQLSSMKATFSPVIGAGLALSSMSGNPDVNLKDPIYSWTVYKEIGLVSPTISESSTKFIFLIRESTILGNSQQLPYVNGTALTLGIRIGF